MKCISLLCHPSSPAPGVHSFEVGLEGTPESGLRLDFEIRADPASVRWPASRTPAFRDGLWHHSCLELFAAAVGGAYREFNFSPSGEYALYDFDAYRSGMRPVTPRQEPRIHARSSAASWSVEAGVPADLLMLPAGAAHLLGVTAVIEAGDGTLSYWAVHHPAAKPDFHHRGGFVIDWPLNGKVEPRA